MNNTDTSLHKAAQYLSSFGIQYLPKQSDDSHTNLGWDETRGALCTRKTEDGQYLRLYFKDLKLEWVNGEQCYPLELEGRSHGEVCVWLHHIALRSGKEEYDFYLHYSLDSGRLKPDEIYEGYDADRAEQLATLRTDAQLACDQVRSHFEFDTEIRIWPHHFDTGGYALARGSDVSIGFGMAIPDTMVDDYYLYVSGYKSGKALSTKDSAPLKLGTWKSEGFEGAVLSMAGQSGVEYLEFMREAISALLSTN